MAAMVMVVFVLAHRQELSSPYWQQPACSNRYSLTINKCILFHSPALFFLIMVRVLVQSRRTVRLGSWADVSLVIAGPQRVDVFDVT